MLETENTTLSEKIRPCDLKTLINSLKLKKAFGIDGIPNECLRYLPRRTLVHLTHLFNHCLRLSYFPSSWKEAKIIILPKPGKDIKFPQNLRSISFLPTRGKLFQKVIQKIFQKHLDTNNLLNASQFGFRERQSTTLHCVRLTDYITLNFNNMSTAAVFLDAEKACDTTWHPDLLYKISKFQLPANFTNPINSYLSKRKFRVAIEGELATPRKIQAGVPQGSVLAPTIRVYSLYINDTPRTPGVHLALFAGDTDLIENYLYLSNLGISSRQSTNETTASAEQSAPSNWWFTEAHSDPLRVCGSPNSVCLCFHNENMQETGRSHTKS
jgi:hypothetical protein